MCICNWPCILVGSGHHKPGLNKTDFSHFWRLGSPRSRRWPIRFLARALVLTCEHLVSAHKGTNPILRAPPSRPRLTLVHSQMPLLMPPPWGVGLQPASFRGHRSVHSTFGMPLPPPIRRERCLTSQDMTPRALPPCWQVCLFVRHFLSTPCAPGSGPGTGMGWVSPQSPPWTVADVVQIAELC